MGAPFFGLVAPLFRRPWVFPVVTPYEALALIRLIQNRATCGPPCIHMMTFLVFAYQAASFSHGRSDGQHGFGFVLPTCKEELASSTYHLVLNRSGGEDVQQEPSLAREDGRV